MTGGWIHNRYRVVAILALLAFGSFAEASGAGHRDERIEEPFFKANQAFKEGHFEEAIDGYYRIIATGHESGHVYYNLGNAYYRANELGRAILNFERARRLIPRDADLDFNLDYTRSQIKDAVSDTTDWMDSTFFWAKRFNLGEVFWAFVLVNGLLWTLLLFRLFFKPESTFYMTLVVTGMWLLTGTTLGVNWYKTAIDSRCVVLAPEVDVMAGPETKDTVLFRLHAGTVVENERVEEGWALIRLPDNKRGWVPSGVVENIKHVGPGFCRDAL